MASGLRGRGGGWFPAARKWRAVRVEGGEPFVVANGAEGEPGSIKDRHLLRTRAADVLAGLALAARGVGAREAVVFLKRSFVRESEELHESARGRRRPRACPCAWSTATTATSWAKRRPSSNRSRGGSPGREPKPPLPAAVGYRGRPTLVHNVETLLRLPDALADPAGFRAHESTFVSLWGDVRRPGLYEVRLGTTLRALIESQGGGAPEGVAFVFPGGPSSPPLSEAELDTPLDPDALRARGSSLGTAALLVVDRTRDPFDLAVALAAFFERESCGQCPPCVRGTESLHKIARALQTGQARGQDVADVGEVAGFMGMHGYCAHCRAAAGSVKRLVSLNGPAVAAVVAGGGARPLPRDGLRSLLLRVAATGRHRGGARVTAVFFLFLLHTSVGLLFALCLVPHRAGDRFFKLCAASAAVDDHGGPGPSLEALRPERARRPCFRATRPFSYPRACCWVLRSC